MPKSFTTRQKFSPVLHLLDNRLTNVFSQNVYSRICSLQLFSAKSSSLYSDVPVNILHKKITKGEKYYENENPCH